MIDTVVLRLVHDDVYALTAVGISLIFSITGVVNFAQGLIVGFGMMFGWQSIGVYGWLWWLALLIVAASNALIGWIINLTTMCPLIKASPIAVLLTTFTTSMMLDNLSQILLKAGAREYPASLPTDDLPVGGVRLGTSDAVALGLAIVAMLVLQA